MRELKTGMPQLDPCCFPLLHPRGTPGHRWFIKKRGMGLGPTDREELEMQNRLDDAISRELEGDEPVEEGLNEDDVPMLAAQLQAHIDEIENAQANEFEDAVEEELNNRVNFLVGSNSKFYRIP